jgi:HlyD family secretion protein
LASAQGALAQAQASYSKLLNGPSAGDIQALKDATAVAQTNLDNSYNGALNTLNVSYSTIYNAYAVAISAQYSYFNMNDQEGILVRDNKNNIADKMADARASIDQVNGNNNINSAISSLISDLNSVFDSLQIIRDQCDQGIYYVKVSATDRTALDTQKTAVTTAITSVNTLQNGIALYKASLQTAENALSAKQAKPRQEDIDLAKAQILSASGQVDSVQATLNNLIITAPVSGTITEVDIKVGEQAIVTKSAIVLQDVGNLRGETNVSEANIASLQIGQSIDYTFDALGPDQHFSGKVLTINPASTVISGVVNYKVKSSLDNIPNIKPGMTVNMTILVASKDNTLAVPSTAIINRDNKQFVRVVDDQKNKTYQEVPVQTGLQADGGLVEIISGLNKNQEIVTYIKL